MKNVESLRALAGIITGRRFFIPVRGLFGLAGLIGGLAIFTFIYAQGFSYITNDPEACRNCHVMNNVFEGWSKGGHQHVAVCNDCHVPHNLVGKMLVKADNGFHHSYAFTFKEVPVAIKARESSRAIVQDNCLRCHSAIAAPAVCGASGVEPALRCVSCHREAGHVHN
jgi:cytochrome c nitrite reductase small subunit